MLSSLRGWLRGGSVSINPVTTWVDESGGTDATTFGSDPDLSVGALNDRNVVQFTSANTDWLAWLNPSAFTSGSIWIVAKTPSTAQTGIPVGRFGTSGGNERYNDGGVGGVLSSDFLSTTLHTTGAVIGDTSLWHILSIHSASGRWSVRRDGVEVFVDLTNTVGGFAGFSLVGRDGPGNYFNGLIAAVIVTNDVPVDADKQRVEGFLAHQWNIASVLDAAHPYKTDPPTVVSTAYSMTADVGTFTYGGQAVNLLRGYSMPAALGTFSIAGQPAQLERGYSMPAALGTFSIAEQPANLTARYGMAAGLGTFSYTGQAAQLERGYSMPAAVGAFNYTGQAAGLTRGLDMAAGLGTFSYTGQDEAFRVHASIAATAGIFSYAGQDARAILNLASFPPSSGGGGPRVTAVLF